MGSIMKKWSVFPSHLAYQYVYGIGRRHRCLWDLPGLLVPGVRCWQRTEFREITCGNFFFLFLHHYSKLNKKGRAMRKGSYWDPPASPHKLVTLKIAVSRLEHLSLSLFTWHYQPPLQRWFMQQVSRWGVVWRWQSLGEIALWEFGHGAPRQRKPINSYIQGFETDTRLSSSLLVRNWEKKL